MSVSNTPTRKRASTIRHGSVFARNRGSIGLKPVAPPLMKIFVNKFNNHYYNYALERIDLLPGSKEQVEIIQASEVKLRFYRKSIKDPIVLSYQKVNQIAYKIVQTLGHPLDSAYFTNHSCILDQSSNRCTICGCLLTWSFTFKPLNPPFRLDYYDYDDVFLPVSSKSENNNNAPTNILMKSIRTLQTAQRFITYMGERSLGMGFEELSLKYQEKGYFPINLPKDLGLNYKQMLEKDLPFKIYSDFEGGNLLGYSFYDGEESGGGRDEGGGGGGKREEGEEGRGEEKGKKKLPLLQLLIRGDTNSMDAILHAWFFFKIVTSKPMEIHIEIQNLRFQSQIYEKGGGIYVFEDPTYLPPPPPSSLPSPSILTSPPPPSSLPPPSILPPSFHLSSDDLPPSYAPTLLPSSSHSPTHPLFSSLPPPFSSLPPPSSSLPPPSSSKQTFRNFDKEGWNLKQDGVFWRFNGVRGGRYGSIVENGSIRKTNFWSLEFDFKLNEGATFFAMARPYTYTDLLKFFTRQEKKLFSKAILDQDFDLKTKEITLKNTAILYKRIPLVSSRCGLPVFLLSIKASPAADELKGLFQSPKQGGGRKREGGGRRREGGGRKRKEEVSGGKKEERRGERSLEEGGRREENSGRREEEGRRMKGGRKREEEGEGEGGRRGEGGGKKGVVFLGRQHGEESMASLVMEGVIGELMSESEEMEGFRSFFDFYVFPMVNPDGVMLGNSRTGVSGRDVNRIWDNPTDHEPEVKQVKTFLEKIGRKQEVVVCLDVHGNFRKTG